MCNIRREQAPQNRAGKALAFITIVSPGKRPAYAICGHKAICRMVLSDDHLYIPMQTGWKPIALDVVGAKPAHKKGKADSVIWTWFGALAAALLTVCVFLLGRGTTTTTTPTTPTAARPFFDCPLNGNVVRPECAGNEMENRCLTLKNTMRSRMGEVLRAEVITDAVIGSYCRISGVIAGPEAPWSAAFPTNASFYKNRLCAHTGWASDWDEGQVADYDIYDMKLHSCMVSYISTNGDGTRALMRMGPRFGNADGHFLESASIYEVAARNGNVHKAWKRLLNEVGTIMYGEKPKYAYNYGCSGAGTGALIAAGTDGAEWDGILAQDFFDTSHMLPKVYRQWGPMIRGEAAIGLFSRNSFFATKFCDADDGISDGTAQWECQGKYHPSTYRCNAVAPIPGFDVLPSWYSGYCFSDAEITLLNHVYQTHTRTDGSIHMPGHEEAWKMPANFEKILKVGLTEKQAEFVRPDAWGMSNFEALLYPAWKQESADQKKEAVKKYLAEVKNGSTPLVAREGFSSGYYDWIKWVVASSNTPQSEKKVFGPWRDLADPASNPFFPSWKAFKDKGSKAILVSRTGDSYSTWEPARTLWEKLWMQPDNFQNKEEMNTWMHFYPLGSKGHCGSQGTEQDKDPALNLGALIQWVEAGVEPQPMMYNGDGTARGGPMCKFPETERDVNGTRVCQCLHSLCTSNPFPPPPSPPPPAFPPKGACVNEFTIKLEDVYGDGWNGLNVQAPTSATYPSTANPTSWIVANNGVFEEYFTLPYGQASITHAFCTQVDVACHSFEYRGGGTWHDENKWNITGGTSSVTGDATSLGSGKNPAAGSIFFEYPTGCSTTAGLRMSQQNVAERSGTIAEKVAGLLPTSDEFQRLVQTPMPTYDKSKGPDAAWGRST